MVCVHQLVDLCGGNSKKHTGAYVGIQPSRVMVKNFDH
jgi:hypothetical protein